MNTIHYLNGKFVTEDALLISPRDMGFARGYAVFDFFRTYNGHRPFMFDYHIRRFFNSAKSIGLLLPWTQQDVKDIITETLGRNDQTKEFAVRIMASGGISGPSGSNVPTLMVIIDDVLIFDSSIYEKGIRVSTIHHKRYKPSSKTVHYVEAIQNMGKIAAEGSGEMLYIHNDYVLEGAYSNFFCVINGTLITPKNNVLPGITRLVVTEKLSLSVPAEIRDIRFQELHDATEAFLSVSGKGIVPVVSVDDLKIGNGKVGPVTKDVMQKLEQFIASDNW